LHKIWQVVVSEIKLYEILKLKLGEKEAEALVEYVDAKLKESGEENSKVLATKEDLAKMQSHLESKINDQLKWLIVMWISQLAAIATIIKLLH
jgi:hypothetical protein